jgi:voltage-gated potassium channel
MSGRIDQPATIRRRSRRDFRTLALYTWALLKEFRWTLFTIAFAVLSAGALLYITPMNSLGGRRPGVLLALYGAWMSLFAQPLSPPDAWYLAIVQGVYPLVGFVVVGEGIVRFAMLMISRRQGEKEWMKVMASTHRDHVVLCGIGHLGFRVLEQLLARNAQVVAIEKSEDGKFVVQAKAMETPLLIRDMKDDQTLIDAGVPHARAIIIATNDDMANMEVALDARRLNPRIRVVMRLFDQQLASKIRDAFHVDHAFSSSALAAATVAAMTYDCRVVSAFNLCGVPHVGAEIEVQAGSALAGQTVGEIEQARAARVLCRQPAAGQPESPPAASSKVAAGDRLVVHIRADRMDHLIAASRVGEEPLRSSAPGRS